VRYAKVSLLLLAPAVALTMDHVTYRIGLKDITAVHIMDRSVELSLSSVVVNRMMESGPTQEHFEFLFRIPKEIGPISLIHTTRVDSQGMKIQVDFADQSSARAFEKFIRKNMRGSNQALQLTSDRSAFTFSNE